MRESCSGGADLSGARFRDVNLTDATISHAWLVNVDIDALVDTVVINGVDVTAYVNERDPWYPLRAMLRPSNPEGMRVAWAALDDEWAKTVAVANAVPEDTLHESVNDEWSFVQTLRHLVFAMDKWFTAPILGERFHPIGLPNTGAQNDASEPSRQPGDQGWPGLSVSSVDWLASPASAQMLSWIPMNRLASARHSAVACVIVGGASPRPLTDSAGNGRPRHGSIFAPHPRSGGT